MLTLDAGIQKINELIYSGNKHIDYARTVEIDQDALTYASGENMGRLLIQYVTRESKPAFEQRIKITCGITAEIIGSLKRPINQVVQNDMVRKGIRMKNERQRLNIEQMYQYWSGGGFNKSTGFENWQKKRFKDLQTTAPNTWIVAEWKSPATLTEVLKPQPFEVPAEWAYNFELQNDNETPNWLLVAQPITYLRKQVPEEKQITHVNEHNPDPYAPNFPLPEYFRRKTASGLRFTLYTDQNAIVYEQIDKEFYVPQLDDVDIFQPDTRSGNWYVRRYYEHKLGFVPAFRIGYMDDLITNGRTKVPYWHEAKNTLRKSLLTVSNMDMSEVIQAFPRHTRYVMQCPGDGEHKCSQGWQTGAIGVKCTQCKGSGVQDILNPQEEIIVPMPVDPSKDTMIDLKSLSAWDSPPETILNFMAERVKELEPRAHRAVYGTEMLIRNDAATKTATEDDNDQQQLQTALEPFAEKVSESYRFVGYLFGKLAGADTSEMDIFYEFQGELYRRGKARLLAQRKFAVDSGAPSYVVDSIDQTLADVQFAGDPYGRQIVEVQSYFFPFTGMSQAQIEYAIASNLVERFYQVLYANYDPIFKELELDNPGFYYIADRNIQWKLLEAKVNDFIRLKDEETPEPTLPALPNIPVADTV